MSDREWFFEALDRVLQRFSPPSDLSSAEKKAWVKGLYHAVDVMTDVALNESGSEQ